MNPLLHKRILLADNDPDYRRSTAMLLMTQPGYEVVEAGSPEAAIQLLDQQEFDLVLTDLRLTDDNDEGDISGLAVARHAADCGIPCIFVTGFPTVEMVRMILRSVGAEPLAKEVVPKASGPQALLDALRLTFQMAPTVLEAPIPTRTAEVQRPMHLDQEHGRIWLYGSALRLPTKQFRLLAALCRVPGRVCSAAELYLAIYEEQHKEKAAQQDGRLPNLIERVNQKLKERSSGPAPRIESDAGRGYFLNQDP